MSIGIGAGGGLGAGSAMNTGAAGPFAGVKGPQAAKATKDLQAKNLQAMDPKAAKGQQLAKGPQGPQANDQPRDLNRTQAKDPNKAQAKDPSKVQDQNKPQGADFGRDGAVSRGQGFSQRDTFQAAEKKDQQGAPRQERTQDPQKSNPQDQVRQSDQLRQSQQAEAVKRAQEAAEARLAQLMQQAAEAAMMRAMYGPGEEDIKETLRKMWKRFLEWLKEMDEIFLKPAPR